MRPNQPLQGTACQRRVASLRSAPLTRPLNGGVLSLAQRGRERRGLSRCPCSPLRCVATHPGHCVALDTVERFVEGNRRYIITFTDLASRFSLAWATRSHASQAAKDFFNLATFLFPFPLQYVLTDNSSEFMKHFPVCRRTGRDEQLRARHLTHWHTYPEDTQDECPCRTL